MTHSQASKKWENMKKRYKVVIFLNFIYIHQVFCFVFDLVYSLPLQELKNPTDGMKVFPETWPYFTLMEGRLKGKAPILTALLTNKDNGDFFSISKLKRGKYV